MKKWFIPALIAVASVTAWADDAAKAVSDTSSAECSVTITGDDAMNFDVNHFAINKSKCADFTIHLKHNGKLPAVAMGHNVVLTLKSDVESVVKEGISSGATKSYLKENDARVIAHTKLIGGGEEDSVTFSTKDLKAGEAYEFFCSFPGHYAKMKGEVEVTE